MDGSTWGDKDHAMVDEVREEGEGRGLLASSLGASAKEHSRRLAHQLAL